MLEHCYLLFQLFLRGKVRYLPYRALTNSHDLRSIYLVIGLRRKEKGRTNVGENVRSNINEASFSWKFCFSPHYNFMIDYASFVAYVKGQMAHILINQQIRLDSSDALEDFRFPHS